MPAVDSATARDEILERLADALAASAYASTVVIYDDSVQDQPGTDGIPAAAPAGQPWIRAGVRHANGVQASLGSVNGKRRQEMSGLVYAQVFTPAGDGLRVADALVAVVLDAYRTGGATDSGVQFRDARFNENGKSGAWHQILCLVDFQYDVIR